MIEQKTHAALPRSHELRSTIRTEPEETFQDEMFDMFIQCAMFFYMEDKLTRLLQKKNIEAEWDKKITRSFDRYFEEFHA